MYIKTLIIANDFGIIRKINFHNGINLIIDETPSSDDDKITGNNVGKTTVLKLIDFCLGGKPSDIYIDPETKKDVYVLVKEFLTKNNVVITLILKERLDVVDSPEIKIERNFLSTRKSLIRKINNESYTEDEFLNHLCKLIFPEHNVDKPTFRQIISHNIRYKDENINNTLKTLDKFTSDVEYETLYLYLLGCTFDEGEKKQAITNILKQEETYKVRLEKNQTKTAYEASLSIINREIKELDKKKSSFNLNVNFEADLNKLSDCKYRINKVSSEISSLNIRRDIIVEAKDDLSSTYSNIDMNQLRMIYKQACDNIDNLHKSFEDLVVYHNNMVKEKIKYITKELPQLEETIKGKKALLHTLLNEERELAEIISKSDTFEALEMLVVTLNEKYRKKGEYENIINQIIDVEENIKEYRSQLNEIDDFLFSADFEAIVKRQVDKFNDYFASISSILYDEQYALKPDIVTKNNQRIYKFSSFNTNLSSGKKQGEIICFDFAYTLFADKEKMSCLHFLLNDKKELMHDNQLINIAKFANNKNIQFVASILKDKLPKELNNEEYFIVKLSQQDKLFKIE